MPGAFAFVWFERGLAMERKAPAPVCIAIGIVAFAGSVIAKSSVDDQVKIWRKFTTKSKRN